MMRTFMWLVAAAAALIFGAAMYTLFHTPSVFAQCESAGGVVVRAYTSGDPVCIRPEAIIR